MNFIANAVGVGFHTDPKEFYCNEYFAGGCGTPPLHEIQNDFRDCPRNLSHTNYNLINEKIEEEINENRISISWPEE